MLDGGGQGECQDLPLTLASRGFTPRERIEVYERRISKKSFRYLAALYRYDACRLRGDHGL